MKEEKPKDPPPPAETTDKPRLIKLGGKRKIRAMTADDWEKVKAYVADPNNKRRYPEIRLDEEDVDRVFGKKKIDR